MSTRVFTPRVGLRVFLSTLILAIGLGGSMLAQQPLGNISGVVTDPTGAVVAGATVTATSRATGATRTATANDQGFFLIPTLQAGEYKLTVANKGFADFTIERVVVEVGQTAKVDVAMKIGGTSEQVQISGADAAAVDTQQATVGGVVNERQINELPLNGRNYLELAKLQPGVEIQEGRSFDPTKSRYTGISVGSRSGREARITIDGVDAVDEHVGTTTINISQEGIQEFQISLSSSDTSAGLSATGAVNVITKRGSNALHGSGFLFGRGSGYAARPSFSPVRPDFDRKQYGGSLGGRVIKDRLFWFGNYEKTDENSAIGISTPYFPSLTSFKAPFEETSSTVRTDWHVSKNNDFLFRWSRNDNSSLGGFGGIKLPSGGNINANTTHQYVWGLDSVLSSRLTNSFRSALTDFKNRVLRPPADAQAVVVPGIENYRIVTSGDGGLLNSGPDNITPQSTFELFGQFRDDVTLTGGNHTWRAGADVVRRRVRVTNFVNGFPSITVVAPASRNPADLLNQTFIDFTIGNKNGKRIPGTPDNAHRNTRISWYVDDAWRMRPNLTLSYGVRYEVDTHPLNNDLDKPALVKTILPRGTEPTPIDKNNFAPHIGVAWDPWKDGKTSFRLGGGIYYAMRISNLVTNERASLAGFNSGNDTISLTSGTSGKVDFNRDGVTDFDFSPILVSGVKLKDALPVISAGQAVYVAASALTTPTLDITRTGTLISNQLQTPYSQQVNFGVQRELPWNSVIDVNVIYSRTAHEFMRDVDAANLFPGNGAPITLGDGLAPTRQITLITSDGFSRYQALTIRYDKRFTKRYQLTASYALSKLETSTADGLGLGAGALVNRNPKANFGYGPFDRRHRLTLNGILELPKGFRLSMISTFNSSLPVNALVGSADLNGDGITGDLLPTTRRGDVGRGINSVAELNAAIRNYNAFFAGKRTPRGQTNPFLPEIPENIKFGDSFISQDFQLSYVLKIKERLKIEATAQVFNAFNFSNLVGPAGLPSTPFNGTLTTLASLPTGFAVGSDGGLLDASGGRVLAGVTKLPTGTIISNGFGSASAVRPSIPTGTGLPRAAQFGVRVSF
ncbi:MAG TPA: carboxypeptidase regulatory-like domain-containing protein [Blastocatellia bacterium]|nr:carboxypeptidase regulatory-like domain-containing protein [Blastocatellia bacterium]